MAIGKRIRFFRNRKGMTQKQLGELLGFLGKTSDVRMAQYESESRTPKQDLVQEMAHLLDVSPRAIGEIDGEVCLRLDKSAGTTYTTMFDMFHAWQEQAARLEQGEITEKEYDQWRYKYPELDTSKQWRKVIPSQELSDLILQDLKPESD